MMKKLFFLFLFINSYSWAFPISISQGIYIGFSPQIGGNFSSRVQTKVFNASNGLYDLNKKINNWDYEEIKPLSAYKGGYNFRIILYKYFLIRISAEYIKGFYGGKGTGATKLSLPVDIGNGTTVYQTFDYHTVYVKYDLTMITIPLNIFFLFYITKKKRIYIGPGIGYLLYSLETISLKTPSTQPINDMDLTSSFSTIGFVYNITLGYEYVIFKRFSIIAEITKTMGTTKTVNDSSKDDTLSTNYTSMAGVGTVQENLVKVDAGSINLDSIYFSVGVNYYIYFKEK